MNTRFLLLVVLLCAVFAFVSCHTGPYPEDRADAVAFFEAPVLSVGEACEFFEAHRPSTQTRALTGSSDAAGDPPAPLHAGGVIPAWDDAAQFHSATHVAVGAPFDAEYEYQTLHVIDDKYARVLPMPRRLVVIKDPETGRMGAYMRFYMPEIAYADLYPESHYVDMLIPSDENDFSGLVIYATLAGVPVGAARFTDGELQASASMADSLYTTDENFARLSALLEGVYAVRRRVEEPKTRASDEEEVKDVNGGGIEEVVVVGKKPKPPFDWSTIDGSDIELPSFYAYWTIADTGGGGAPGASGDQGNDNDSYDKNTAIEAEDKESREILDSLFLDCMGRNLINGIKIPVEIGRDEHEGDSGIDYLVNPYDPSQVEGYIITLGQNISDYVMFEELMHVYQGFGPGTASYGMNLEIEAKVGWCLYLQRTGGVTQEAIGALGGKISRKLFDDLSKSVRTGDFTSTEFTTTYERAVMMLRQMKDYADETKYPFDRGEMNFDKLMEIIQGCLGEK